MTTDKRTVEERIDDFMHFVGSSALEGIEYTKAEIDDSIARIKAGQSSDEAVAEVLEELSRLRNVG